MNLLSDEEVAERYKSEQTEIESATFVVEIVREKCYEENAQSVLSFQPYIYRGKGKE